MRNIKVFEIEVRSDLTMERIDYSINHFLSSNRFKLVDVVVTSAERYAHAEGEDNTMLLIYTVVYDTSSVWWLSLVKGETRVKNKLRVINDCTDENGEPACWFMEINHNVHGRYAWITLTEDGYEVEVENAAGRIIPLSTSKSLRGAKRWVTKNLCE